MEYRSGLCSSCDAEYRIPTNFAHDQARCRQCGGTVHIGPATSEEKERERLERKKAAGPSMKERLLAKRQQAEQAAQTEAHPEAPQAAAAPRAMPASVPTRKPAAQAAPKPVAKPAAAKPVVKPAAKAAAPKARAASPVRKPALAKAAASKEDSADDAGSQRKSSRRSSGGGKKRASGGRSSGRARGAKKSGDGEKSKGKLPIVAGALILVLAVVGFFFKDSLFGSGNAQAAENESGATAAEDAAEASADQAADSAGDEVAAETPKDSDAAGAAGDEDESDETPEEAPEVAEEKPEKPKAKPGDPDSVDLMAYPVFKRTSNTTEAEWEELNAQMEVALDRDAAIRQTKAIRFMKDNGRKSMPVIMNRFRTIDVGTEDGNALGMQIQRMLEEMTRGRNYGWRDFDAEGDSHHYFNKRVIEQWIKSWDQVKDDIKGWANLAKLEPEELEALLEELGESGDMDSEMDDAEAELDDLFD